MSKHSYCYIPIVAVIEGNKIKISCMSKIKYTQEYINLMSIPQALNLFVLEMKMHGMIDTNKLKLIKSKNTKYIYGLWLDSPEYLHKPEDNLLTS